MSWYRFPLVDDAFKYNERKSPEIDRKILFCYKINSYVVFHILIPKGLC